MAKEKPTEPAKAVPFVVVRSEGKEVFKGPCDEVEFFDEKGDHVKKAYP